MVTRSYYTVVNTMLDEAITTSTVKHPNRKAAEQQFREFTNMFSQAAYVILDTQDGEQVYLPEEIMKKCVIWLTMFEEGERGSYYD